MSNAHALPTAPSVRVTHAVAKSMRPHQWLKNTLLFSGLVFSQSLFDIQRVLLSIQAFCLFSFAASAVYLLNDLVDLKEDRLHPKKKLRPLAAGIISPMVVMTVMVILATVALAGGLVMSRSFCGLLFLYLAMNVAYSVRLKHVAILDVMIIAAGFLLRVIAGAVAIGIEASPWLILCTLTLSLLVGFGKRRNEIVVMRDNAVGHRACLAGYTPHFLDLMMTIAAGSAVVTYALYTMADETVARLGSHVLVFTTPFVIYGIFRYLFLIHVESKGGDPSRLFVSDRPTLINGGLWTVACIICVYTPVEWLPWWISGWSV